MGLPSIRLQTNLISYAKATTIIGSNDPTENRGLRKGRVF